MTCKKCGAEILENTKFCGNCGEAVERSVEMSEPGEEMNPLDENAKVEKDNPELAFRKSAQLGRITYKKIETRVEITKIGLRIEKNQEDFP